MLQKDRRIDWKEEIKIIVISSFIWAVGYVLVWLTKWIIVNVFYDRDLIKTALEQFQYRSIDAEPCEYSETLSRNVLLLLGFPMIYLAFLIMESIVELVMSLIKKVKMKDNIISAMPYLIIMVMPFVWYYVIRNHSHMHSFFTYRNLLLFCTGLPIALQKLFEKDRIKRIEEKNKTEFKEGNEL